jgi:hypothetical protein
MTQQSISILKDCELWCDFDSQYVDAQRGIVRDRSGHGRHPVAEGGPTFGVNGPDSFEAVSLDGSDDLFVVDDSINVDNGETLFVIVKPDVLPDGELQPILSNININNGSRLTFFQDKVEYTVPQASGNASKNFVNTNEYITVCGRFDGSTATLFVDGEQADSVDCPAILDSSTKTRIATNVSRDKFLTGNITFAVKWSRALSVAEIDYLNRLTAPRRSNV